MLHVGLKVPATKRFIVAALQGLVAVNREYLRHHSYPRLYDAGVRYRTEPKLRGPEDWQTIPELIKARSGDCEDLAAARVAELQEAGEAADVHVKRTGKRRFHAVVRRGDGTIEDPSKLLR